MTFDVSLLYGTLQPNSLSHQSGMIHGSHDIIWVDGLLDDAWKMKTFDNTNDILSNIS